MSEFPIDWTDDTVRQYLTAEAHQKSKAEFERTHIDIDKIRADYLFPHPTNDEFVTQEEFRDAVLKSSVEDDNRIFILRGETGSGKSQLCQWLEYQIGRDTDAGANDTHIALHVSRSETRIKDIVDILTDPIDMSLDVRDVEALDPEKVANAMLANLDAYEPLLDTITETEATALVEDRSRNTDLRGILEENIRAYQEAVASDEDEDIPDLLTKDDYRELALAAFGQAKGGDTIFPTLQGFVDRELSTKMGVGDFQQRLKEISERYVELGLRPVLICEDLTTFSVLKEQLLDHIFQLDSGHYDVVLGWTTGWEKDNIDTALGTSEDAQTYMKDRAEGYLSTTDENGQAYFLTDDVTVELTRKYLSVIREESETTASVDIPEADFDGLYPFNAEFVKRAYENLVQDGNERRTPRLLLMRIVRECLTSTAPPFEAIDGNPYVKQFPTPVALSFPSDVQSVAKWYGIPTAEGNLRVPRSVFKLFDLSIPQQALDITETDVFFSGGGDTHVATFDVRQVGGRLDPGDSITVEALLSGRGEPDVDIRLDGEHAGYTDEDGLLELTLPNEEREVEVRAEKGEYADTTELPVGTDSLKLVATPSRPEEGESVRITAQFNGEPTPGVAVERDGQVIGETGGEGTIELVADDPPSMTLSASHGSVTDSLEIPISGGQTYPVDVDDPPKTIEQYQYQYQQWVSNGDEYNSSRVLRDGVAEFLQEWYDPTRLANPNSSATGTAGIYYTRGQRLPVSLQGVDERQGISVELPFGSQYASAYEPLFWYGVSSDGELPREEQYELNYAHLQAWADDQVAGFKRTMREDIESCFDDWTVEEFVVLAQYLLINAAKGKTELTRDLVFEEYRIATEYDDPIRERFSKTDPFREAFDSLATKSSVPGDLAEGFFKLKENFVDSEQLNDAYGAVANDLDTYIEEAMLIDTSDLPDAYRVGTTRSQATIKFVPLLESVRQYAQELNGLGPEDVDYITETVAEIDEWFDKSHSITQLRDRYDELMDVIGQLDISIKEKWVNKRELLDDEENLQMTRFANDVERFRDIESTDGPELVALMHEFERSRDNSPEWEIYEALGEMIQKARAVDVPETDNRLEAAVRNSDEFQELVTTRENALDAIGGER